MYTTPGLPQIDSIDNHLLAEDGVGGREGSFSMCTFWLVEALTRAGNYDKSFIAQAVLMFEDMISYSNHLGLYSEEINRAGEVLALETRIELSSLSGISHKHSRTWLVSVPRSIWIVYFRSFKFKIKKI